MTYRILIVEDDEDISRAVCAQMAQWGLQGEPAADLGDVMAEFVRVRPHLVLMDISLPFMNGYHWCTEIRKASSVPVIFVSSASDNMNIIMAMNMGADDFIAKPFDMQVLIAKIQAVLRRSYGESLTRHVLETGSVKLNLDDTTAEVAGQKLELTKNEFLILKVLMEHPGQVVTREQIMERLWGAEEFVDDNTLTVNMTRIRKKLEAAGAKDLITTRRGMGYIIGEG